MCPDLIILISRYFAIHLHLTMNYFYVLIQILFTTILLSCSSTKNVELLVSESKSKDYYREDHRLQYHFSPEKQWMNDPNGMVFYDGEYHLFYQYHPGSNVWGPMHWGHAISRDLMHWQHMPVALHPDEHGTIFSGSAVVDWENTSGLGTPENPPMVAIFTYHDAEGEKAGKSDYQTQGIAYSTDNGRTWQKYDGNPVLTNPGIKDFRDPKVIFDEGSDQWVMVLAANDHVKFYGSPDLKEWKHLSDFGKDWGSHAGVWECPDLFPLSVIGSDEEKWVLIQSINPGGPNGGSATQYFIGDFDGQKFTLDPSMANHFSDCQSEDPDCSLWIDFGRDNYAGVTWSDIPSEDGRRIFLGWMSNWDYGKKVPTSKWRSAMTLPRTLGLIKKPEGYRILSHPVEEIQNIRENVYVIPPQDISGQIALEDKLVFPVDQCEVKVQFRLKDLEMKVALVLKNDVGEQYEIGYRGDQQQFYSDRRQSGKTDFSENFAADLHVAPAPQLVDSTLSMQVFFDKGSMEMFAQEGEVVMTELFFPTEPYKQLVIKVEGGSVHLSEGFVYELKDVWRRPHIEHMR